MIKKQAPANSRSVRLYLRKYPTRSNSSTPSSYIWFSRPMFEECTEHATQPSAWVNAGVTSVHGRSIIADTIRGEHIKANQTLSSPNITGGTITGNTINGTTINGSNISGTNISDGTVTGATVKGGRIEGGVISGSTILGDIVKAVILTKKGNNFEGTVPASEISSRTVVVPSISFKANSGETSTVAIYIDGTKVSEDSVSGIKEQIIAQGITPPTIVSGTIMNGSSANYVSGTIQPSTIATSFWLRVPVSGSISGYKQITGKSVVVRVTSNNATALSGQNSLVALVA